MKHLIVSLHDYHSGSQAAIKEQIETLSAWGVKNFSILAVPHFHHKKQIKDNAATMAFLSERQAAGDDLVIHGFYHDRLGQGRGSYFWTKIYTADEAEFLNLGDGEVRHRLTRAQTIWEENGWKANGFIAPAWLMPEEQDDILRRMGLKFTVRLKTIKKLKTDEVTETQSLCYSTRAPWRCAVSLRWNSRLLKKLKTKDVIRLSLHPNDLTFEPIKQQIQEMVTSVLADGYEPTTYAAFADLQGD